MENEGKLPAAFQFIQEQISDPRAKAFLYLAENTPKSLRKAHSLQYESGMPAEIGLAIAKSDAVDAALLGNMISETRHYFVGEDGSSFITDYHSNRGKLMDDPHQRRAGAIATIAACLESPKADRELFFKGFDTLKQITENVVGGAEPGSNKNVYDAFIKAVNNPNATDETFGSAVMTLYHMEDGRQISEKHHPELAFDTKDALDVFDAVADDKNAAKHSVDSVDDFYYAISAFADREPQRVSGLVNKMLRHPLNTDNSKLRANRILSNIRVKSAGKVNVHVNE